MIRLCGRCLIYSRPIKQDSKAQYRSGYVVNKNVTSISEMFQNSSSKNNRYKPGHLTRDNLITEARCMYICKNEVKLT